MILDPFSNVIIIDSLPGACDRLCCNYDLLYHLAFLIGSNESLYLPWKFDSPEKSIHLVLWKVRFYLLQIVDVCKAVFPFESWSSICHQSPSYVHCTITRWAGSKLVDILQLVLMWLEWSESCWVLQVPGLLPPFLGFYSKISSSSASKCCFCRSFIFGSVHTSVPLYLLWPLPVVSLLVARLVPLLRPSHRLNCLRKLSCPVFPAHGSSVFSFV